MPAAWKVSLHGGHSGAYCDHATGSLTEVLDAAVAFGYSTFGVTEHAPRVHEKFLFEEEIRKCWEEYTEQVGMEMASSTAYFTEALNEILADGQPVFS